MKLTCRYRTYQDLCDNPPQADVYMVGSDQVWNVTFPCGQDDAYYLNYIDSPYKMSYASSLGREFTATQLYDLKEKIQSLSYISVREKISSSQLSTVGVNAKNVLDPVFLISKDQYLQDLTPPPCKDYLLVYAINEDKLLDSVAQRIALERKLKIVLIGGFAKKIKCDAFYRSAGPKEFLSLIANADFILTSSFHGTAFSLVFNKQFAIVQPEINSLRIDDILNSVGLTDRVIKTFNDFEIYKKTIDYNTVNHKLNLLIEQSKQYLIHCLQDLESKIVGSEPLR
ncbi:MAG: polysaccharide pyruvyl transferase family protein [Desulfosporosinus sp.]|nr:polysaccharide pyruvyl transferase family protein [Desulfosporosinus sp.]